MICGLSRSGWQRPLPVGFRVALMLAVFLVCAPPLIRAADAPPRLELLYGENEIFPSALISVTDQSPFPPRVPQLGDPTGLVSVVLTAPRDDCPVKITLAATEVFNESAISLTLPKAGTLYRIAPYLLLDHARIMRLKHPIPAEVLRARIELDGRIETATRRVSIHALNDCLLGARFGNKAIDASYLGAAFVNENNPEVPARVIRHALDRGYVERFVGYAGGPAVVEREVEAVYLALKDLGFKFSATTRASLASTSTGTQWIRLSSDSIRSDQANCIDGTVIFASVLTALRLRVVMFVMPFKHAFLGVYRDAQSQSLDAVLVIETIRVGTDPFKDAVKAGRGLLDDQLGLLARMKGGKVRALSELRPSDLASIASDAPLDRTKLVDLPTLYVVDIPDARLNRGIQPVAELMPGSRWRLPTAPR